jgi:putative isomerase
MCKRIISSISFLFLAFSMIIGQESTSNEIQKYSKIIKQTIYRDYRATWRKPAGVLKYPFLVPGSKDYANQLWDWDSWLSDIAMSQIVADAGNEKDKAELLEHSKGCVLNFLSYAGWDGWLPGMMTENGATRPEFIYQNNMHKPVIAQHAAFITKCLNGNAAWLADHFEILQHFITNYQMHHYDKASGLFYWQNDIGVGIDNDPTVFFRPDRSSGNIYLNSLMYRELLSMEYLAKCLGLTDLSRSYSRAASDLDSAMNRHCWDPRDGMFYSVDLNLKPVTEKPTWGGSFVIHSGFPRDYECLTMRIEYWACFMPLWNKLATPAQAKHLLLRLLDTTTFNSPFGIRSLSKMEKMYDLRASGNPSNWRGPIWVVSNYMVFRGLVNYGFNSEARQLAEKTIVLLGRDVEKCGAMHEFYDPEMGIPLMNKGFQNWDYLVANMMAWYEGRKCISEF